MGCMRRADWSFYLVLLAVAAMLSAGCGEDEPVDNNDEPQPDEGFLEVVIDQEASSLSVVEGEEVSITADIENTGDETASGAIELSVHDEFQDVSEGVELDGGDTTSVTLGWQTQSGDAGDYTAEMSSPDDSDTVEGTVHEEDSEASVEGTVVDTDDEPMEGAELVLWASEDDEVDRVELGEDGSYEFSDLQPGSFTLSVEAAGLNPDYSIEESDDGASVLGISLDPDENTQDVTVDWESEIDLMIDGGVLDFQHDDPDGELAVELLECEEQSDGSWEPIDTQPDDSNIELVYEPDDACFQLNGIGVDLASGVLDLEADDVLFPDVEVIIEDHDAFPQDEIERVEVDFEWLFDEAGGVVDYQDGALDVGMDLRILVGGSIILDFDGDEVPFDFGARDGQDDCQMTGGWGGDIADPESDDADEQIGDYLHDSIELRTTTGESGPDDMSGEPFDADARMFVTVDNAVELDRLSEGEYGADDPGGASCGDIGIGDIEEDFAEALNELLELPAEAGSVYGEFNFVVTSGGD